MTITFTALIVWLIIAAIVGIVGELIAGRRAPDGIIGAIVVIMVMHRATATGAAPMSGIRGVASACSNAKATCLNEIQT